MDFFVLVSGFGDVACEQRKSAGDFSLALFAVRTRLELATSCVTGRIAGSGFAAVFQSVALPLVFHCKLFVKNLLFCRRKSGLATAQKGTDLECQIAAKVRKIIHPLQNGGKKYEKLENGKIKTESQQCLWQSPGHRMLFPLKTQRKQILYASGTSTTHPLPQPQCL